jgi:UDP-2,3-diacylglucosamine hydrolase
VNVWSAPPHWRAIDFVSDLHLAPELPRTAAAFLRYLAGSRADAVCLLGDVFEAWVGDDCRHQPFEHDLVAGLAAASALRPLYFMAGNRDFLVGADLCADAGMTALPDPTCLQAWGQRWLLCHGDAQCLSDTRYQAFRTQVRSDAWQRAFLARPLQDRVEAARAMRRESRMQRATVETLGDLDAAACRVLLRQAGASVLLHGHTHRPAEHDLGAGLCRVVLSDWDLDDDVAPRAEVLRLHADGQMQRLSPDQACSL